MRPVARSKRLSWEDQETKSTQTTATNRTAFCRRDETAEARRETLVRTKGRNFTDTNFQVAALQQYRFSHRVGAPLNGHGRSDELDQVCVLVISQHRQLPQQVGLLFLRSFQFKRDERRQSRKFHRILLSPPRGLAGGVLGVWREKTMGHIKSLPT